MTNVAWPTLVKMIFLIVSFVGTFSGLSAQTLSRIVAQNGRFIDSNTGKTFTPTGFNYVRLSDNYHGTFRPGYYDGARASTMFDDLRSNGFNTVRVFMDPQNGRGLAPAAATAMELNPDYLNNFVDFLDRAASNQIRVIPTFEHMTYIQKYGDPFWNNPAYRRDDSWGTENVYYQLRSLIDARAQLYADVAQVVKNAGHSNTIFAYETQNEMSFFADRFPYSELSGTIMGPNDLLYDMGDPLQRQALADASAVLAVNEAVRRIRLVDDSVMVSGSVFSPHAVGRTAGDTFPVGGDTPRLNERFPARLLALAGSDLSYLDVHPYADPRGLGEENNLVLDLETLEWQTVKELLASGNDKPIILGEFGTFRRPSHYMDIDDALSAILDLLDHMRGEGIAGHIFWTYDTDEQPDLWNSKSGDGRIFRALAAYNAIPEPNTSVFLCIGLAVLSLRRRNR